MNRPGAVQRILLHAVRLGVVLVLLTPLVVATGTAHPYSVGKAVYARSLIEVVFVLWVALAVAWPHWRPSRSWLLALLGIGLGVSALSAVFGVSPSRSFWSTYIRMQGTVELAHWFAYALVVTSVFRTSGSLRGLLACGLGVGLLVSLGAVALSFGWQSPWLFPMSGQAFSRVAATLGNPAYLGAYLMVNVVLALGLLARSFIPEPAEQIPEGSRRRAGRKDQKETRGAWTHWVERAFYGSVVLFGLWGISLGGSMGALAGLLAAVGALTLLYSLLARSRRVRWVARTVLGLMAAGATAGAVAFSLALSFSPFIDSPLLKRVTDPEVVQRSFDGRIASWMTGSRGYLERPVLGWGEGNYEAVFGRYATGRGAFMPSNDHAHNMLIEVAATKGTLGLAAYLAIWILTFLAILRGVRGVDARERAFGLFAGAALLGLLVQTQTLFHTVSSSLNYVLLLAVAVRFERRAWPPEAGRQEPARPAPTLGRKVAGGCIVLGAAALSGAGLASNQAIYSGSAALYRAEVSGQARFMGELGKSIEAFGPMANVPRLILFENITENWNVLRVRRPAEAARLLRWANAEAPRAEEAEPENWMVQHALARLYRAVATTNPEYAGRARRYHERALKVAPHKDPYAPLDASDWFRHRDRF